MARRTARASGALLAEFDGPSVASIAAGLQLLPVNAGNMWLLDRLALYGVSLDRQLDGRNPSPSQIKALLKSPLLALRVQDPYEDVFAVEIQYDGGPYLATQGLLNRSGRKLDLLIKAVFGSAGRGLPTEYVSQADELVRIGLTVSDVICRRAGLSRGTAPINGQGLFVPDAEQLRTVRAYVTFSHDDLAALMPARFADRFFSLAELPGWLDFYDQDRLHGALIERPLLAIEDGVVVAAPGELLASIRHHMFVLADELGCRRDVVGALADVVAAQADEALQRTGAQPIRDSKLEACEFEAQAYVLDTDKRIELVVYTDRLDGYKSERPFSSIPNWNGGEPVRAMLRELDAQWAYVGDLVRVLRVIVVEAHSRPYFLGLEHAEYQQLTLNLDDLEDIIDVTANDPLALWYFAQADGALHDSVRVLSFSVLDRFAQYRDLDCSYYFDDERKPDSVSIASDFGLPVRLEALAAGDRHLLPVPNENRLVEVRLRFGQRTAPIYVTHPFVTPTRLVVESGSLRMWVKWPNAVGEPDGQDLSGLFADAVAFWLWKIIDAMPTQVEKCLSRNGLFEAEFEIEVDGNCRDWRGYGDSHETDDEGVDLVHVVKVEAGVVRLRFVLEAAGLLVDPRNLADRSVVRALTKGLTLLGADLRVEDVDVVAKVSNLRFLRAHRGSELSRRPTSIPQVRWLNPAASSVVLDLLGTFLESFGPVGMRFDDQDRGEVLNGLVGRLYAVLCSEIDKFDATALLTDLIRRDEAVLRAQAVAAEDLVVQAQLFGPESAYVGDLRKKASTAAATARSGRFLIELVTARPPSGLRMPNLETYDLLVALADQIIGLGTLSDAIRYGLSRAQLTHLRSGRLGIARDDSFYQAIGSAADTQAAREWARITGSDHETQGSSDWSVPIDEIEAAVKAEFGFTITEYVRIADELLSILFTESVEDQPSIAAWTDIITVLVERVGVEASRADQVLERLTLSTVADLQSLGSDWYPWLFSRDRSYNARPFVDIPADGTSGRRLAWGVQRLGGAPEYRALTVYTGRVRSASSEMKALQGKVRARQNREFEKRVAEEFREAGISHIQTAVKKVGGRRIHASAGEDLGDIDVLAVDSLHRVVFVVEAKDYEMARTPAEFKNEVDKLLIGEKSALAKHARRLKWVRENLRVVLSDAGVMNDHQHWVVVPVVVTSQDLVTPGLVHASMSVVGIRDLQAFLMRVFKNPKRYVGTGGTGESGRRRRR